MKTKLIAVAMAMASCVPALAGGYSQHKAWGTKPSSGNASGVIVDLTNLGTVAAQTNDGKSLTARPTVTNNNAIGNMTEIHIVGDGNTVSSSSVNTGNVSAVQATGKNQTFNIPVAK